MFRFTIRDLLWLTVVVALAVGWDIDRQRLAARCGLLQRSNEWLDNSLAQQRLAYEDEFNRLEQLANRPDPQPATHDCP